MEDELIKLVKNAKKPITAKEISKKTDISERTIRTRLNRLIGIIERIIIETYNEHKNRFYPETLYQISFQ